jgi:hypothetical protein
MGDCTLVNDVAAQVAKVHGLASHLTHTLQDQTKTPAERGRIHANIAGKQATMLEEAESPEEVSRLSCLMVMARGFDAIDLIWNYPVTRPPFDFHGISVNDTVKSVYFIRMVTTPFVKIGFSGSVAQRMKTIYTGSPYRLELLAEYPTVNYRQLERDLHEHFEEAREHGEWFNLVDIDPMKAISEVLSK